MQREVRSGSGQRRCLRGQYAGRRVLVRGRSCNRRGLGSQRAARLVERAVVSGAGHRGVLRRKCSAGGVRSPSDRVIRSARNRGVLCRKRPGRGVFVRRRAADRCGLGVKNARACVQRRVGCRSSNGRVLRLQRTIRRVLVLRSSSNGRILSA